MAKHRYYYYFDERNDDFANNGIDGKPTPADFEYFPKNIFYRIFKPIVYYLFVVCIVSWASLLFGACKVRNAKVLRNRRDRKKGYFVYGNHTTWVADAALHPVFAFPRSAYIVANPDAISIPGVGTFLRMLGAMPTPSSRDTYVGYMSAIERMYNHGDAIVIYPEAHIWPKYNKIRDFADVSFKMPVKLDAPCFVKSTVYKKDGKGHTGATIYYDGPFYPNPELSAKQAQKELRDRVYAKMCERCAESELDIRYHYQKVDSPSEMRSEFKEV